MDLTVSLAPYNLLHFFAKNAKRQNFLSAYNTKYFEGTFINWNSKLKHRFISIMLELFEFNHC
jgi:hypothetical protein